MSGAALAWIAAGDRKLLRLLSTPTAAPDLWRDWKREQDLDRVAWSTLRLLAAVAGRLPQFAAAVGAEPRIAGIRRFCWSNGQVKLSAALAAWDILRDAGIEGLLLKGAAAMAAGDASPADRYVGDVDLLVPPTAVDRALDLLVAAGWSPADGTPVARVKARVLPRVHGINLVDGRGGELDLHWCLLPQNRAVGDDDRLWREAEAHRLAGREVRCPAAQHRLLHALAGGAQWSDGGAADWAIDTLALLRNPRLDWRSFATELAERRLHVLVGQALRFMAEDLGVPLPPAAAAVLVERRQSVFVEEARLLALPPAERELAGRDTFERAERLRRRGRPLLFARRRLQRRRLILPQVSRLFGRSQALAFMPGTGETVQLLAPAAVPRGGSARLFLRVAGDAPLVRLEAWSGTEWIARWRLRGRRRALIGARLTPAALASLCRLGATLAPVAETRQSRSNGERALRQDPVPRVEAAWLVWP